MRNTSLFVVLPFIRFHWSITYYGLTIGSGILIDSAERGQFKSEDIYGDDETKRLESIPLSHIHRDVDTFLLENSKDYTLAIIAPTSIYGQAHGNGGVSYLLFIYTF